MTINVFKTENELISAIAIYFIKIAQHTIEEKGIFNTALAGGNSPKKFYQMLSSDEFKNKIDWSKVNFFFGDERYVPAADAQRNSWMVQKYLLIN